jgi:hypothetical protein
LATGFSFSTRIAARLFTTVSDDVKRGMKHLGPLIKERFEKEALYGKDWPEKPVGMLSIPFYFSVADSFD